MLPRLIDGIGINLCAVCEALWLDSVEREKFEAYLKEPDRIAAFRPLASGNLGEDVYSDYGIFAALRDFLRGWVDFF